MAGENTAPFVWGPGGQPMTPEQIRRERALATALLQSGMDTSPIRSPWQGAARMVQALVGGIRERAADQAERNAFAADAAARAGIFGGGTPAVRPDVVTGSTGAAATAASPTSGDPAASNIPASLIRTESGGRWGAQNDARGAGGSVGHFGRLQFGQARLREAAAAGAIPAGTTPQQFMASPQLQQAAERWHFNDIDNFIRTNGLDRAIGQTINGVPVTADGMRAVAHLGGTNGLRRFIETGGRYNPADRNGTSLLSYLRTHASQRPLVAAPAADQLSGSDGMEDTAPLIDGRTLPPDQPQAAPQDELAGDPSAPITSDQFPQGLAMTAPMPQPRPMPFQPPPEMPASVAAPPTAPMGAPMPQARPVQAAATAPLPVPRPNIEPPPGATPAGPAPAAAPPGASVARALMGGMSERDRLMLLRDEGSLGGGEADALRAGLPQGSGIAQALMTRQQSAAPPASPVAQALIAPQAAGAPPAQPQGAPVQMQAPGGVQPVTASPAAASGAGRAASPPQNDNAEIARLQAIIASPNINITPQTRQLAYERMKMLIDGRAPVKMGAEDRLVDPRTGREIVPPSGNRPTDRIREYEFYSRQTIQAGGRPDPYEVWDRKNRREGASQINTTETGDSAFNTELAKKQAQMFNDLVVDGQAARQDAARIGELRRLAGNVGTGAGANLRAMAAQYGLKIGDNVGDLEAFQAIVNQLVPQQRPAGSGAMSDRDVTLFRNSLPSLVNTPQGNAILFDTMQSIADYRLKQAEIAARAQTGAISRQDAIRELNALPDPLKAFREHQARTYQQGSGQQQGGPVRVQTPEEARRLPSGTPFVTPDGRVMVVP